MQKVTFTKPFTVDVDAMTKLTYPEGWTGIVDDDVAEDAANDGAIEGSEAVEADEDESLADDAAALADMTAAPASDQPADAAAAPAAPATPKK